MRSPTTCRGQQDVRAPGRARDEAEFPVGPGATGNSGMVTEVESECAVPSPTSRVSYLIAHEIPARRDPERGRQLRGAEPEEHLQRGARVKHVPGNSELHIVDPPRSARIAYPISTFTYAILRPVTRSATARLLRRFVEIRDRLGPGLRSRLDFVPLPKEHQERSTCRCGRSTDCARGSVAALARPVRGRAGSVQPST